jgi:hypothetical protein
MQYSTPPPQLVHLAFRSTVGQQQENVATTGHKK